MCQTRTQYKTAEAYEAGILRISHSHSKKLGGRCVGQISDAESECERDGNKRSDVLSVDVSQKLLVGPESELEY